MIFIDLEVENFFSIREKMNWHLKDQGLVLIEGENHDSDTATSNGAGKSTLFEALVWCLWGKTTRGQTGDDVVNRRVGKDCRVSLFLQDGADIYEITRYRKHKQFKNELHFHHEAHGLSRRDLTQGTATLTQSAVDNLLGIDFQTFIQGPMMPQGSWKRFSEMSDSEQKAVLEKALQIGVLAAAHAEAKERLSKTHLRLTQAAAETVRLEDELESLEREKAVLEGYRDAWEGKRVRSVSLAGKALAEELVALDRLWDEFEPMPQGDDKRSVETLQEQEVQLEEAIKESNEAARVATEEHRTALVKWLSDDKAAGAKVDDFVRQIARLESLGGACPTCLQNVEEEHVGNCTKLLQDQVTDLRANRRNYQEMADTIRGYIEKIEVDRQKAVSHFHGQAAVVRRRRMEAINEDIERQETLRLIDRAELDVEQCRSAIGALRSQTNPYGPLVEEKDVPIAACKKKLARAKSVARGLQLHYECLTYWKQGFSNGGIKSYILESVTPFLNERAERYVNALMGKELEVEFHTQTKLKSGEVREKFSVSVRNKFGAATYSGNSGGERGRVDVAINFSFSDLVSRRASKAYPQRFLDEPFEALDDAGVEAVMELLSEMAGPAGSIFVVTHLSSMKGLFHRSIKMVKKDGQSVLC